MKVKVGDQVYDSNDQPILLILNDHEKSMISNMLPQCYKYCACPSGTPVAEIERFMGIDTQGDINA